MQYKGDRFNNPTGIRERCSAAVIKIVMSRESRKSRFLKRTKSKSY